MSNEIESPCIGVCSVNPVTKFCYGCSRTIKEMENWSTYTVNEKLNLLTELEKRNNELFGD